MRYSADKSVTVRLIVIYTWLTNTCVLYIIGNKRSYSVILILIPGTHSAICWAFYQLLLYCSGRQSAGCSVHADPAHERSSGQPGPRLRLQGRGAQVPGSGINHSGFTKPHTGILYMYIVFAIWFRITANLAGIDCIMQPNVRCTGSHFLLNSPNFS